MIDPEIPPTSQITPGENIPSQSVPSETAPCGSSAPPTVAAIPPPLPANQQPPVSGMRRLIALLLSLCLGLFLADGIISLVDDSLILAFGIHLLTGIRA